MAFVAGMAMATPSMNDVQNVVKHGDYTKAETMMHDVVTDKPKSAKAHYIYAEVLAHNGKFADATSEALQAKTLDPQIHFTKPEKFQAFQAELLNASQAKHDLPAQATHHARPTPMSYQQQATPVRVMPAAPVHSGMPVGTIVIILLLLAVLWFVMTRMRRPVQVVETYAAPNPGPGYGSYPQGGPRPAPVTPSAGYGNAGYGAPGYGQSGPVVINNNNLDQGAGMGSGIGRTLAAGAAGVAVGMLAEELLENRREHGRERDEYYTPMEGVQAQPVEYVSQESYAPEENDSDSEYEAQEELENRQIDFGNGGDDWGDNSGDSSSSDFSDDSSSSSSDDSW